MLEEQFSTSRLVQGIEGKVTAELFDAKTGNLVQREETHNFIAKPAIDFLHQAQRTIFKKGIYTLNSSAMKDYQLLDKQNAHIILTDLGDVEDATNETHMYGKPVGWASRDSTYTGADSMRGTVNASLSNATPNSVTWTFDWPTQAANGVIRSCGWVKGSYYNSGNDSPTFATDDTPGGSRCSTASRIVECYAVSSSPNYSLICSDGSGGYFAVRGDTTTIYNLSDTLIQNTSFSVSSAGLGNYIRGIAWDNTNSKLWVLGYNGKIASFTKAGIVVNSALSIAATGTVTSYMGMTYDGQYLWIADNTNASLSSGSGTGKFWQISSTSGDVVSSFTIPMKGPNTAYLPRITDISFDPIRSVLWARRSVTYPYQSYVGYPRIDAYSLTGEPAAASVMTDGIWSAGYPAGMNYLSYFGASSGTDTYSDYSYNTSTMMTDVGGEGRACEYLGDNTFMLAIGSGSYSTSRWLAKVIADGMGSRALLPSPIVKTSSQTLRITYRVDFS